MYQRSEVDGELKTIRMMMSNDTYTHPPTETRMLLKSGADSNLEMEDGRTPIHIAAEVMIMTMIDNIDGCHMVALWCFFLLRCCLNRNLLKALCKPAVLYQLWIGRPATLV